MATLEKVMEMKRQGVSESEIIKSLQVQGTSPKEISDALSQSQIKQAVASEPRGEAMQPSIMGNTLSENPNAPPNPTPGPATEEEIYQPQIPSTNTYSPAQNPAPQEYAEQQYYPQQNYQENGYEETNIDNMIEIAEQVFMDKIKKMQTKFNELLEFKAIYSIKIDEVSQRLKRMEKMFDQMQISIINKVGNYGKGLETLKKELEMVEDSFSKTLVPKKIHKKTTSRKRK